MSRAMARKGASGEAAICVGVRRPGIDQDRSERSLAELCSLTVAAGGMIASVIDLGLRRVVAATYIGTGQIERIAEEVARLGADLVVMNAELTGTQARNLEQGLGARVIDRTGLILDIFALRARTMEGKLQVELAQHAYRLPRLVGGRSELSRLGGGIGTRGPGETALEADRRVIRRRMGQIKERLVHVRRTRETQREGRRRRAIPVAAVVGYTNAGKTTLINRLAGADLFAADMPFATLDPALRQTALPGKVKVVLSDTVGFIQDLPHQLVEAFQATLEEVRQADVLINVVDASDPGLHEQMEAVGEVLERIHASEKPTMVVYNKIDKLDGPARREIERTAADSIDAIAVSAATDENLDRLKCSLARMLGNPIYRVEMEAGDSSGGLLMDLQRRAEILSTEEDNGGISIIAVMGYTLLKDIKARKGVCVVSEKKV